MFYKLGDGDLVLHPYRGQLWWGLSYLKDDLTRFYTHSAIHISTLSVFKSLLEKGKQLINQFNGNKAITVNRAE